jgi:hypothetical protein
MEVSGQPLLFVKISQCTVYWVRGCVNPRTGLGEENILAPSGKSNPGCPASVLIELSPLMISVLEAKLKYGVVYIIFILTTIGYTPFRCYI